MAISTYTELQTAIGNWLNRSDLTARIPEFIALAEGTLNKVIRSRFMVTTSNYSLSSGVNTVALATDVIAVTRVVRATNATETLTQKPLAYIDDQIRLRQSASSSTPLYFAVDGGNMIVMPVPSGAKVYKVSAMREIPPLASNSTNWLLTHHPDLYLYTSLWHAYPYLDDEDRAVVMASESLKMVQALLAANQTTTLEGQSFNKFEG